MWFFLVYRDQFIAYVLATAIKLKCKANSVKNPYYFSFSLFCKIVPFQTLCLKLTQRTMYENLLNNYSLMRKMKGCTGLLLQNSYCYLFFHINNCTPDSKIVEFYKIVKCGGKGVHS